MQPRDRLPALLLVLLGVEGVVLAVSPADRAVWAIENALALLALLAVVWLVTTRGTDVLRPLDFVLVAAFLALHLFGAHHTYAGTPGPWETDGRNHFDRLVHLSYGLFLTPPLRRLTRRWIRLRGAAARVVPWSFLMTGAALFEVGEMAAALLVGGRVGDGYLGAQGDRFDAVWDIAMAALGGLVVLAGGAVWDRWRRRDAGRKPVKV